MARRAQRVRMALIGGLVALAGFACGDGATGDDRDASSSSDGSVALDAGATGDAGSARDAGSGRDAGATVDAGGGQVSSTLVATGCAAQFSSSRVMVHYNTALGVVFTDPTSPYSVQGTISFDFPSTFTGAIPNPYSWVESGVHKEVAVTDTAYTTWGNHCWAVGDSPTGGSATLEVIDGPAGIVRVTFQDFQLRNCVTQSSTCTLSGSLETSGTGVFE